MANSFTARSWPIPWAKAAWTWPAGEGGGIWIPFGGTDPSSARYERGGGNRAPAAPSHRGQPGLGRFCRGAGHCPPRRWLRPQRHPPRPGTAGMQHLQHRDGSLLQWWVLSSGLFPQPSPRGGSAPLRFPRRALPRSAASRRCQSAVIAAGEGKENKKTCLSQSDIDLPALPSSSPGPGNTSFGRNCMQAFCLHPQSLRFWGWVREMGLILFKRINLPLQAATG